MNYYQKNPPVLCLIFLQVKTGVHMTMQLVLQGGISWSLAVSHVCVIGCLRIGYWRTCCCHSNESPFEGRILGRAVASPKVLGALI